MNMQNLTFTPQISHEKTWLTDSDVIICVYVRFLIMEASFIAPTNFLKMGHFVNKRIIHSSVGSWLTFTYYVNVEFFFVCLTDLSNWYVTD